MEAPTFECSVCGHTNPGDLRMRTADGRIACPECVAVEGAEPAPAPAVRVAPAWPLQRSPRPVRATGDFFFGVFAAFAVPYFTLRLASGLHAGFGGWAAALLLPAPVMYMYGALWLRRQSFGNGVLAGSALAIGLVVLFAAFWAQGFGGAL